MRGFANSEAPAPSESSPPASRHQPGSGTIFSALEASSDPNGDESSLSAMGAVYSSRSSAPSPRSSSYGFDLSSSSSQKYYDGGEGGDLGSISNSRNSPGALSSYTLTSLDCGKC